MIDGEYSKLLETGNDNGTSDDDIVILANFDDIVLEYACTLYNQSMCRDTIDICLVLLYHLDLLELINASKNLNDLLTNTLLCTDKSSLDTTNMCMMATSALITVNLVGVLGSKDQSTRRNGANVDLVALLEWLSSNRSTLQTFLDTYFKVIDSFNELVASPRMLDYVIDLNIYWCVLTQYMYNDTAHIVFE